MRRNIFEQLISQYNIPQEMNKLVNLFASKFIYYEQLDMYYQTRTYRVGLEELCEMELLPKWKQRGSCLSFHEIKEKINFPNVFIPTTSTEIIISCLEYYYNILYLVVKKFDINNNRKYKTDVSVLTLIAENMKVLLEHLHYEININKEDEKVILVPKNPAATAVAEITDKEHIAFAILKYNHNSLRGDLEGKRQLLLSIANEYEPLLKNPIDGFTDYFKKATFLLNNLNLRHNNKSGKDKKQFVVDMPNKELEKWYDELYQLLLFCVLIKDNIKRKKEIEDLVKKLINL